MSVLILKRFDILPEMKLNMKTKSLGCSENTGDQWQLAWPLGPGC